MIELTNFLIQFLLLILLESMLDVMQDFVSFFFQCLVHSDVITLRRI